MGYFRKEDKVTVTPVIKAVLKKYDVKATISVRHLSTLVVTLRSGPFDFERKDGGGINGRWAREHNNGIVADFVEELQTAMDSAGNYNNSDPMTDYFDVGYYTDITCGKWNKEYIYIPK
jgi:hypothetical protein